MPQPKNPTADAPPTTVDVADAKVEKPEGDDPVFTLERLSRVAGEAFPDPIEGQRVDAAMIAGAYHGQKLTREVTIADAKTRIRAWLKAPVEPDPREGEEE